MNISGNELPGIGGDFRDFREYCNSIVGNVVRPVALALAVLFFVFSVSHQLLLVPSIRVYMVVLAGVSTLVFAAIGLRVGVRSKPVRNAHVIVFIIASIILLNSLAHLLLTGDPIQTTNLILLVIGIGSFALSWPWLVAILIPTDLGFLLATPFLNPVEQSIHFGFGLLGASLLSALIMTIRLRAYHKTFQLHQKELGLIGELERTVAETLSSERRYRLLMENTKDVIWSCDTQGSYTYISPSSISLCGYEPQELMKRNLADLIGKDTLKRMVKDAQTYNECGEQDYFLHEAEIPCKQGGTIWIEANISPVFNGECELIGFQGINREITARVMAKKELELAQQGLEQRVSDRNAELENMVGKYRSEIERREKISDELRREKEFASVILQNSRDGFAIFSRDGNSKFISKIMESNFGDGIERIRKEHNGAVKMLDLIKLHFPDEEDQKRVEEIFYEDIQAENPNPREFNVDIPGQGKRWLRIQITPLAESEDVILSVHDITESKEREQNLYKTNEELRELDELKNNFLSNISHELRTPLVSVKGYIELMLRGFPDPDRAREWLKTVLSSTKRLEHIIEDLINISRLHSKRMTFKFRPLDIAEVITSSAREMSPRLENKQVLLNVNGLENAELIFGDRKKIESVIINLLDNAIKFSPSGSEISVTIERHAGNYLLVAVSDQGIGISEQYLDKVFTRFFQVDSSATRNYGGSGIGLALVKEIVEAHNGKVWAQSEYNRGTTFFFLLPLADPALIERAKEQQNPTMSASEDNMANKLEILVVDDDPYIREFITTMLQLERHNVVLASDGAQCLNLLENKPVDLVLLDIAMPGINGIEVCKRIRGNPDYAGLPVYMLTARTGEKEKKESAEAGANGFIEKPFSIEYLSNILKKVAHQRT